MPALPRWRFGLVVSATIRTTAPLRPSRLSGAGGARSSKPRAGITPVAQPRAAHVWRCDLTPTRDVHLAAMNDSQLGCKGSKDFQEFVVRMSKSWTIMEVIGKPDDHEARKSTICR